MPKNRSGYVVIVTLLIVVLAVLAWYFYFWKKNWFVSLKKENAPSEQNQKIDEQLRVLKKDIQEIQNKRDREIYEAME